MSNNNSTLLASQIIDLKGRKVGSEDFETAMMLLKFCENDGFRGASLVIAANVALGLGVAVQHANHGNHEAAGKQAGNVLWVLKKDRTNSAQRNYKALGSMVIECRDGQKRKLGDMCEWYMGIHLRIAEQIAAAKQDEANALANAELETLQFSASVANGVADQAATAAVKAA